ncbi:MAG: NADAR family protein [Bradymonadia bacterium]
MTLRNRAELIEHVSQGKKVKWLFFWGHRPSQDGRITASCLSQWWVSPFDHQGVRYATAEHFMMAGKARLFGDDEMLAQILDASSPAQAKKLGRRVRGFNPATWDAHKSQIVTEGNVAKFASDPALTDYLLSTGERVLVEASPVDRIWGIGLKGDDPKAENPRQWRGKNLLGFALMAARDQLRAR